MNIKKIIDTERWGFAKAMLVHRSGYPAVEHNASLDRIEAAVMIDREPAGGGCACNAKAPSAMEDKFTKLSLDHDKYYDAYHELKDAAIALVQRLELDKDVKKNNWWLNERAKIMEVIYDNEGYNEN